MLETDILVDISRSTPFSIIHVFLFALTFYCVYFLIRYAFYMLCTGVLMMVLR